jgi:hypothetical protein
MQTISLKTAASEIRQACIDAGDDPRQSPFFVIVGAGISYPPVPLAPAIIEHCKTVAGATDRAAGGEFDKPLEAYSRWMGLAYRQAKQRQKYLRDLIDNRPISLANLRLAHLLGASKLTNLVVTTNFDDLLARALRMFGQLPVVCDHPRTVARVEPDRSGVQIVHVHGSYLFYDTANLRDEVAGRARIDQETSLTIAGLLDSILWTRSPLVVGYSGWEGDVIMSALRRRMAGGQPLGTNVYWFSYRREEPESLAEWLRDSGDVQFVVPPEPPPAAGTSLPPPVPTQPASEVFERLIAAFNVGAPSLFADPLGFFADQLAALLPGDDGSDPAEDPYAVKALVQRIRRIAAAAEPSPASGTESQLEALRDAIRRSNYARAVEICASLVPERLEELTGRERKEVLSAAELSADALLRMPVASKVAGSLARALCVDPQLEQEIGLLPPDVTVIFASRHNQYAYETSIPGDSGGPSMHVGAFSYAFQQALNDPRADRDGDGRISLFEAVVAAGQVVVASHPQIPVIVGDGSVALFGTTSRTRRKKGRLLSILVGVSRYKKIGGAELAGPVNDVKRFANVLRQKRSLLTPTPPQVYTDAEATTVAIRQALATLSNEARPGDLILFYFTGHGEFGAAYPDKWHDPLLCAYEFDGRGAGAISLREVIAIMARARNKKVLVIDAG